jgi:hypothetical protein
MQSIRQHIESFSKMDSHCKRKDTNRQFLEQDLSITKMYDLYKTKCIKDGNIVPFYHLRLEFSENTVYTRAVKYQPQEESMS